MIDENIKAKEQVKVEKYVGVPEKKEQSYSTGTMAIGVPVDEPVRSTEDQSIEQQ